jgi:hypothetical protein
MGQIFPWLWAALMTLALSLMYWASMISYMAAGLMLLFFLKKRAASWLNPTGVSTKNGVHWRAGYMTRLISNSCSLAICSSRDKCIVQEVQHFKAFFRIFLYTHKKTVLFSSNKFSGNFLGGTVSQKPEGIHPMRELNINDELELVTGAITAGDIALVLASVGASAAATAIAGAAFGGPAGGVAGAIVGAGVGIGYALSGGTFGRIDQAGTDYCGCNYH